VGVHFKSWLLVFLTQAISLLTPAIALGQSTAPQLIEILKSRAGSVETFQADVRITETAGSGNKKLARAQHEFANWLTKNQPNLPAKGVEARATQFEKDSPPRVSFIRYYAQKPGRIRMEDFGEAETEKTAYERAPIIRVCTNDRWKEYTPAPRTPGSLGTMIISVNKSGLPEVEVARGQAVPRSPFFKESSERAAALRQVDWDELLRLIDRRASAARQKPLQNESNSLPVLDIATPAASGFALGSQRFQIWFDPTHGSCPIQLLCEHLAPNRRDGKEYYLTDVSVDWSDPIALSDGTWFFQTARLGFHHSFFAYPLPGKNSGLSDTGNDWPQESYEIVVKTFRFSNIRTNEPLSPTLFDLPAPKNTNVIDEAAGVHSVVGSTGEMIFQEALRWRDVLPPTPRVRPWFRVPFLATGLALTFVVLLYFYRRARRARS
jgi:outer membrane lipoprotein-sorting protein